MEVVCDVSNGDILVTLNSHFGPSCFVNFGKPFLSLERLKLDFKFDMYVGHGKFMSVYDKPPAYGRIQRHVTHFLKFWTHPVFGTGEARHFGFRV